MNQNLPDRTICKNVDVYEYFDYESQILIQFLDYENKETIRIYHYDGYGFNLNLNTPLWIISDATQKYYEFVRNETTNN